MPRRTAVIATVMTLMLAACSRVGGGVAENTIAPGPTTTKLAKEAPTAATPSTSAPTPATNAPTVPPTTTPPPPTALPYEIGPSDLRQFSPVPPGSYTMGELGVSVNFTVDDIWATQPIGAGHIVITRPGSFGPGDHDVVFLRPRVLIDATTNSTSIEPDDLDAWLASLPPGVAISEVTATSIDGEATRTFRLTVEPEAECVLVGVSRCADLMFAGSAFLKTFDKGFIYDVFWIDQAVLPIVIVVGTTEDDPDWLDVGQAVVDSIVIG